MRVVGVRPGGADEQTVDRAVEQVATWLGTTGRVTLVRLDEAHVDSEPDVASTTVSVDEGGNWIASGRGASPDGVLEAIAPHTDVAVLVGEEIDREPTITVGDMASDGSLSWPDIDEPTVQTALEEAEPIETLDSLVSRVKAATGEDRAGAIATFTGRVRVRDHPDDDATELLEFERYDEIAEERMATIERELEDRPGVQAVAMHHRTGVVHAGEDIVFVVVLAGHREEAFRTVQDGINRLKAEVPLFKREVTESGEFWVHQHESGH